MDTIVNKIAESGLITLDLADFLVDKSTIVVFDISEFLFQGLLLKEKDFRESMKQMDWQQYAQKHVAIVCTTDAIVPMWAYMLITAYLKDIALSVHYANEEQVQQLLILQNIEAINAEQYRDARVIIKGCGDAAMQANAYVAISRKLLPVVKTLMFGEPCSTVPIYKRK